MLDIVQAHWMFLISSSLDALTLTLHILWVRRDLASVTQAEAQLDLASGLTLSLSAANAGPLVDPCQW